MFGIRYQGQLWPKSVDMQKGEGLKVVYNFVEYAGTR